MEISNDLVDHIAHLARLKFEGNKRDEIRNDLSNIIDFVDKLSEIDTDQVEPLMFMSESINVLREDNIVQDITQEEALKNAGHHDSDYFKISKVLDQK